MSSVKLGAGSYGAVFSTPKGDKAVKFFADDNCLTSIREINIMQMLRGHPLFSQLEDVVSGFDVQQKYGVAFPTAVKIGKAMAKTQTTCIVMNRIIAADVDPRDDISFLLLDLLLACEFMLSRKIVHRDISINNVLFTFDPKLKRKKAVIVDFGSSVFSEHNKERNITTRGFVPPEMSKDTKFIVSTDTFDMFSSACVIFNIATDEFFHEQDTWKQCTTVDEINGHAKKMLELVGDEFIRNVLSECLGHFSSRSTPSEIIDKHFAKNEKFQKHIKWARKLLTKERSPLKISDKSVVQDWSITNAQKRLLHAYNSFDEKLTQPDTNIKTAVKFIMSLMMRHHTADTIETFIRQHCKHVHAATMKALVESIAKSVDFVIMIE